MLKRIITAAIGLALFLPAVIFADKVPLPFLCAMAALALVGVYEICGCVGVRKSFFISVPTYTITAAVMALGILYSRQYISMEFKTFAMIIFGILFFYLFFVFSCTMFSNGGTRFVQTCETAAVTVYILTGFLSMIFTRFKSGVGLYNLLLIFIGVWMTDSGAYFIGRAFGKKKLIPDVSPNKTVAGAIGGIFGCLLGYAVYGSILKFALNIEVNFIYLLAFAVIVSAVDQIGDLIASFIKRERGIKDFGKLFPGHGGVMDRFDSSIAVAPVVFFLLYFTKLAVFKV